MQQIVAILFIVAVAGCVTTPVKSLTDSEHGYALEDDEKKIIRSASGIDDEIRRKGLLLQDEELTAYVRDVGTSLVPAAAAQAVGFHFYVLRDSVVNAFALPNGSIYLNVGLLARLETEAQLAHVISHEIAHVVRRHGLQRHRNRKATIVAAHIADVALFGTSIAYLPAISALAGYSRENEAEADRLALDYLALAGYPLEGAEQVFKVLEEVKRKESLWGSVYSSHPDNQQRAQQTRQIIESGRLPAGVAHARNIKEYRKIRDRLILENLRLKLNVRQYQMAAEYADQALVREPASPWIHYYRGEAFRLMAEDPVGAAREHAWINDQRNHESFVATYRDNKQQLLGSAKQAYQQALAAQPGLASAYRGLGLVAYAEGNMNVARDALNFYLIHGREISDRAYINNVLGRLKTP